MNKSTNYMIMNKESVLILLRVHVLNQSPTDSPVNMKMAACGKGKGRDPLH